jgi:hypothetical protein
MKCDIHMYGEKFVDGRWVSIWEMENVVNEDGSMRIDFVEVNQLDPKSLEKGEIKTENTFFVAANCEPYLPMIYQGNSLSLFSILADIDNGYYLKFDLSESVFRALGPGQSMGLAHKKFKVNDGFNVISPIKGLSEDCCKEIKDEAEEWNMNGHHFSYLTLQEILDFDWDQKTRFYGYITPEEQQRLLDEGDFWPKKESCWYSFEISKQRKSELIKYSWEVSYRDCCEEFWEETVEELKEIAKNEGLSDDNIRIVFWFDN